MRTPPERFDECRGFEERRAWLARENRKRCDEAAARKAGTPVEHEDFELNPPAR